MADTKITDLTLKTLAVGDEFVINDVTDNSDGKTTAGAILDIINGDINVDSSGTSTYNAGSIVNADVSASAAIAYSKLNLTGAVLNADLAGSIAASKLVGTDIATVGTITTGVWNGTAITYSNLNITNSVLVADLADGTDGELITWDAAGAPAVVAVGSAGQVLTSNGIGAAPTFQAAGAADNLGNHTATEALKMAGFDIENAGVMFLTEQAAAEVDVAGKGQLWVKTATPNELYFTDDAGTDAQVVLPANTITITNKTIDGDNNTISNLVIGAEVTGASTALTDTANIAYVTDDLSVFAATTSLQLKGVISDETGSGALVFATSPTLVTPALGTPASGTLTNCTGLPAAGLSDVTSTAAELNILDGATLDVTELNYVDGVTSAIQTQIDTKITASSTDTLTNKTLDGDNNTVSNLAIGAEVGTALTETQEIWIPASAMVSTTTNGAEFAELELATNDIMLATMNFDTTTSEKAQFWWTPPANWNAGTVKFTLYWTTAAGGAAETIDFDLAAVAFANDNPIDASVGTAANVTDTWIADNDMHVTSQSTAITIAGSPAAGESVLFQLSRDVASDDLGGDVKIIGLQLEYTINDIGTT